jgi:hypothetical protein
VGESRSIPVSQEAAVLYICECPTTTSARSKGFPYNLGRLRSPIVYVSGVVRGTGSERRRRCAPVESPCYGSIGGRVEQAGNRRRAPTRVEKLRFAESEKQ